MAPPLKYASKFGAITLRADKARGTLTYQQKGGNQTAVDRDGVSLDAYVHALYGLSAQTPARAVLTHLDQSMDYETLKRELPPAVEPGFDGYTWQS